MKTMLEFLSYINQTGASLGYRGPDTRREMSKYLKENHGIETYRIWQRALKRGYVRTGRVWGFVLTQKGFDEFIRLRNTIRVGDKQ